MIWDLAPQNFAAVQLPREYGFKETRKLSRMAFSLRSGAQPLQAGMNLIFALAGFEYG